MFAFEKYNRSVVDSLGTPYDYLSLMHYDAYAFTKNGLPTILTKQPEVCYYMILKRYWYILLIRILPNQDDSGGIEGGTKHKFQLAKQWLWSSVLHFDTFRYCLLVTRSTFWYLSVTVFLSHVLHFDIFPLLSSGHVFYILIPFRYCLLRNNDMKWSSSNFL